MFELGHPISDLARVKQAIATRLPNREWLVPPADLSAINVGDVLRAQTAQQHRQAVEAWAKCIFEGWALHHDKIARLIG